MMIRASGKSPRMYLLLLVMVMALQCIFTTMQMRVLLHYLLRLDVAGSEPSADVTVNLNPAAGGHTLVGNPFSSNFDISATGMTTTGASIQNNVSLWNSAAPTPTYSLQDRTTPYIVRPWQGFWVEN